MGRHGRNFSCKQRADLLQLRPPNDVYLHYTSLALSIEGKAGLAQPPIRGLIVMKSAILKVAAVAAFTMLAGCQDLKPLQADVDNLKQQVSRLTADLAAAKSSADAANAAAQSASSTASGAQSAANQALAAAQASQSCCDATNEKIDRMFRRSISK
jgi:outer membrane murein-binding lipoprotein Lpp